MPPRKIHKNLGSIFQGKIPKLPTNGRESCSFVTQPNISCGVIYNLISPSCSLHCRKLCQSQKRTFSDCSWVLHSPVKANCVDFKTCIFFFFNDVVILSSLYILELCTFTGPFSLCSPFMILKGNLHKYVTPWLGNLELPSIHLLAILNQTFSAHYFHLFHSTATSLTSFCSARSVVRKYHGV